MDRKAPKGGLVLWLLLLGTVSAAVSLQKETKAVGKSQRAKRKMRQRGGDLQWVPIKMEFPESVQEVPNNPELMGMRRRVARFNRRVATDQFTEHFLQPGTFLDLGGWFPTLKVRARLCSQPNVPRRILLLVCRRFKNRYLFWKKQSNEQRSYRKLASVESFHQSKAFFERKLTEIDTSQKEAAPKATKPPKKLRTRTPKPFRHPISKRVLAAEKPSRKKQLKMVRSFLNRNPKPRKAFGMGAPAKHAINFDDSRLVVHMFAREKQRQPEFVRPENDPEDVVIQPRIQLHP